MARPNQIAEWMASKVRTTRELHQEDVVYEIEWTFGDEFVYLNKNGNLAISKEVLKEFKKLTDGTVVWEKSDRLWRPRLPHEDPSKRQAE